MGLEGWLFRGLWRELNTGVGVGAGSNKVPLRPRSARGFWAKKKWPLSSSFFLGLDEGLSSLIFLFFRFNWPFCRVDCRGFEVGTVSLANTCPLDWVKTFSSIGNIDPLVCSVHFLIWFIIPSNELDWAFHKDRS